MRRRHTDDSLAAIPLFSNLTAAQLRSVSALLTRVTVSAGRELTVEGGVGRELFVIIDGEVEVRHGDHVVASHGPGSFVGEIALLLDRPRTATVVATRETTLDVVSRREFHELLEDQPSLYAPLLEAVAARLDADLD